MNIGQILHDYRTEKKMTLAEVSSKSGVALATLSRIENGKMTGTLESHMRIAEALEVKLSELYKNLSLAEKQVEVHTKDTKMDVFVHDKKSSSEVLISKAMNKKMMPILIKIDKAGLTHREETKPGVEKFIYVLEGKVEATVGDERYALTKGDTLYFESSILHHFKNTGPGEARLISVISPPTL